MTCPEPADLEAIDVEPTPFGSLVLGGSRFEPRRALSCSHARARQLDVAGHIDDASERVLLVFARAIGDEVPAHKLESP